MLLSVAGDASAVCVLTRLDTYHVRDSVALAVVADKASRFQ